MSDTTNIAIDVDALLDEATPRERTIPICLRGDLVAKWEDLTAQFDDSSAGDGLGESEKTAGLRAQIADVEAQMKTKTMLLRLRALPKPQADKIIVDNVAREGNKMDQQIGYNSEAVEAATIRACVVEPELTAGRWAKLAAVLNPAQWRSIMQACDALNYTSVDLPFLSAASESLPV